MPANTIQIYCGISVSEADQVGIKANLSTVADYIPDYTSRKRASAGLALLHLVGTKPNAAAWAAFFEHCLPAEDAPAFMLRLWRSSSRVRTALSAAMRFEDELTPQVEAAEQADRTERDHLPESRASLAIEATKELASKLAPDPGPAPWESQGDDESQDG